MQLHVKMGECRVNTIGILKGENEGGQAWVVQVSWRGST